MVGLAAAGAAGQAIHRRLPALAGRVARAHPPAVAHLAHRSGGSVDRRRRGRPGSARRSCRSVSAAGPSGEAQRVGAAQPAAADPRAQQRRGRRQRPVQHRRQPLALRQRQRLAGARRRRLLVGTRGPATGRRAAPGSSARHSVVGVISARRPGRSASSACSRRQAASRHVVALAGVVQAPVGQLPARLALHQRVTQLVQHQLRQAVVGVQGVGRPIRMVPLPSVDA